MDDCIFCKIVSGSLPSKKVYEDEHVVAFMDIQPQAPEHIIVIPKEHHDSLDACNDEALLGRLMAVCARIARQKGLDKTGYRLITNIGVDGAQSVGHLHLHVLGGRKLGEKLG